MTASRRATPRSKSAPAPTPATNGASAPWSAAARHQMECSMLAFVAVLKSAEALHRFLLGSIHRARARHESVRSRVHRAGGADQLAALQFDLWRFDTDAATRYWEEAAEVFTHMNAEVMDQTSHALALWVDDAQRATAELAAAVAPGDDALLGSTYKPFASAVRSAMSASR